MAAAFSFLKPGENVEDWAKKLVKDMNSAIVALRLDVVQPGMILRWPMATAPLGYLLCDGATYATATYPNLFVALSGVGATFVVPTIAAVGGIYSIIKT